MISLVEANDQWGGNRCFPNFHLRAQHYVNAPVTNRSFSLSSKRSGLAEVPNVTGVEVVSKLDPWIKRDGPQPDRASFQSTKRVRIFSLRKKLCLSRSSEGPVIGFKFHHSTKLVVVNPRQTADGVWSNQPQTPSARIDHSYRLVSH
jgi:hypothetical protein